MLKPEDGEDDRLPKRNGAKKNTKLERRRYHYFVSHLSIIGYQNREDGTGAKNEADRQQLSARQGPKVRSRVLDTFLVAEPRGPHL